MPHRVATFFRSHSNSNDLHTDLKKAIRPHFSNRTPSSSSSSIASNEDKSVKMAPTEKKRLSLAGLHHSPKNSSNKLPHHAPITLGIEIESPPLVFYGTAAASTGALLSGQLKIQVSEDVEIESLRMVMSLDVFRKKPFHAGCKECSNQSTQLTSWDFLAGPSSLRKGEHTFPFSYLLDGKTPATMKSILSTLDYLLRATLTPKHGEPIKFTHTLNVKRAIPGGVDPRNSTRVFPPTNLTAKCNLPPVIHPIGETNFTMHMDGIVKRNVDSKTQTNWKLKRLTWHLDEVTKTISPPCAKHAAKVTDEEVKKGIPHTDSRILGNSELRSGWKTDSTGPDGCIELEFPFKVMPYTNPTCDMKSEDGTEVSHILVVEMVVTEEIAPINRPTHITPTGAARVLRMHFNIILTERGGLGISWDEEQPPLYENVPASPPGYKTGQLEDLPEYEDLERLEGIGARAPTS